MDNDAVRGFARLEALIEQQGKDAREQATNTAKSLAVMESKVETLNASQIQAAKDITEVRVKQQQLADEQVRDARELREHIQHDAIVADSIRLHMERTEVKVADIQTQVASLNTSTGKQNTELDRQTSMLKRIDRTAIIVAIVSTIGAVLAAYLNHQAGNAPTPEPAQHIQP